MEEDLYRRAKYPDARDIITDWCHQQLNGWGQHHQRETISTVAGPTHLLHAGAAHADHTVLFLPGSNSCTANYLPAIQAVASNHRIIAADLPGEPGLSSARRVESARDRQLAVWLAEVLDHVHTPVTVLAHSRGAAVALDTPSPWIRARILTSPAGIRRSQLKPGTLLDFTHWALTPSHDASARLVRRLQGPQRPLNERWIEWFCLVGRYTVPSLSPAPVDDTVLATAARRPLSVFTGRYDPFFPPHRIRPRLAEVARREVHTLADSGHLPSKAAWRELSQHIADPV